MLDNSAAAFLQPSWEAGKMLGKQNKLQKSFRMKPYDYHNGIMINMSGCESMRTPVGVSAKGCGQAPTSVAAELEQPVCNYLQLGWLGVHWNSQELAKCVHAVPGNRWKKVEGCSGPTSPPR